MSNDNNTTAPNPLSDWLDDKLIIVGLDKSDELSLRKKLEEDLTKSFIKEKHVDESIDEASANYVPHREGDE